MDLLITVGFPLVGLAGALLLLAHFGLTATTPTRVRVLWSLASAGMACWAIARLLPCCVAISPALYRVLDRSATMVGGIAAGMAIALLILRCGTGKDGS